METNQNMDTAHQNTTHGGEDIVEALGIEQKDNNPTETPAEEQNNSAENTLNFIANLTLFLGIFISVICLFTICFVETPKDDYFDTTEKVFSWHGFMITIAVFISSLMSWAVLRVFTNISLTLKQINRKIKQ